MMRGWALTEQGQRAEGIAQMHQGLDAWQALGIEAGQPYWLALLAEGYEKGGQNEQGLRLVTEALTRVDKTGERWWEAELHRLKVGLLLARSPSTRPEAGTGFHQA